MFGTFLGFSPANRAFGYAGLALVSLDDQTQELYILTGGVHLVGDEVKILLFRYFQLNKARV